MMDNSPFVGFPSSIKLLMGFFEIIKKMKEAKTKREKER